MAKFYCLQCSSVLKLLLKKPNFTIWGWCSKCKREEALDVLALRAVEGVEYEVR